MRAAVLDQFGSPLTMREVPTPQPGPGEILVRVRAAGICRTDLKIVAGLVPTVSTPLILGHEPAGEVSDVGSDVRGVAPGDRVAVSLDVGCANCPYCRDGHFNYCAGLRRLGFERDGALAEYLCVPAVNAVQLGSEVPFEIGATIPDAVGSSYHAVVTRAQVRPSQTVVVYGLGGLGLVGVQVAALAGAQVVAVARDEGRRRLAEELGAGWSFDPDRDPIPERVLELTEGVGAHAVLDFVGIDQSIDIGIRSCRKGGRIVVVGYAVPKLVTDMTSLVLREVSILGSRGSTRADLNEAAALVSRGALRPVVAEQLSLEEVNDGLAMLRSGEVTGRLIVRP